MTEIRVTVTKSATEPATAPKERRSSAPRPISATMWAFAMRRPAPAAIRNFQTVRRAMMDRPAQRMTSVWEVVAEGHCAICQLIPKTAVCAAMTVGTSAQLTAGTGSAASPFIRCCKRWCAAIQVFDRRSALGRTSRADTLIATAITKIIHAGCSVLRPVPEPSATNVFNHAPTAAVCRRGEQTRWPRLRPGTW